MNENLVFTLPFPSDKVQENLHHFCRVKITNISEKHEASHLSDFFFFFFFASLKKFHLVTWSARKTFFITCTVKDMILFWEKFISFRENVSWEVFCREAKILISFLFLKKAKRWWLYPLQASCVKKTFARKVSEALRKSLTTPLISKSML